MSIFIKQIFVALVCVIVASCNHTQPTTSQSSSAREVAENDLVLSVKGKDVLVAVPKGYCDRTDSVWGIAAAELIKDLRKKSPQFPEPKILFKPCDSGPYDALPWGLVGVAPAHKLLDSQKTLNNVLSGFLKYSDAIKKIGAKNFSSAQGVFENLGFRAKNMEMGRPEILRADENVIIIATASQVEINGQVHKEISVESSTLMQGFILKYVIYFDADEIVPTPEFAGEFAKLMARLKSQNK